MSSCVRVTTPSTSELPLSTATAFFAAETTVCDFFEAEMVTDWARWRLRDTPRKEERSGGLGLDEGEDGVSSLIMAVISAV